MAETHNSVMKYVDKGYRCSQIMMLLSLDIRKKEDPFLIRALGALGGGICTQRTCGTLTGAACVLSSYFPRSENEPEPQEYRPPVQELVDWFEQEFGSLECRDLVEFNRECILEKCPGIMAATFEKVLEILEKYDIDPYG